MSIQEASAGIQNAPRVMPLRRDDLIFEELDGEAVLYDPRCGAVHHFDAMTLCVWHACDGLRSLADIASVLTERYGISLDEALVHVERLIAEFRTRDLLQGGVSWAAVQSTTKAVMDVTRTANAARDTPSSVEAPYRSPAERPSLSRRQLVRRGAVQLVFVAPVISTFFTPTANAGASGPASASGPDGCKNVGFSCDVNADCCDEGTQTACQQGVCCVQHGRPGCTDDDDCCNQFDACVGGVCQ
jgi:hypothetical protein